MHKLALSPKIIGQAQMTLPGSKSISNRVLLLAALSRGNSELYGLLDADDVNYMQQALTLLGVTLHKKAHSLVVEGVAGRFPNETSNLFLGNAGTAVRPLTAVLAMLGGTHQLSGVARMHERPIGDLVEALRSVGCQVTYLGNVGYPPLLIGQPEFVETLSLSIKGDVSSQYLTALLMSLPLTGKAACIKVEGELISKPYIEITLKLMAKFGVQVTREGWQQFSIAANQTYQAVPTLFVEGDASSASYFLAAGALASTHSSYPQGFVTVEGVGKNSIQGDVFFAEALAKMNVKVECNENSIRAYASEQLIGIDLDCNHIPDAAMTLAVLALKAKGTTTLRNIASWRVKETDRLTAMVCELRKMGAEIEEGFDFIKIIPPLTLREHVAIDTYDDHRMAMCFGLISLMGTPVVINEPECVNKTFPTYFEVLAQLASVEKA
ncbi:MAG: 3-phosphoshikimate 1-carboxyvinyltransferase [Neisseriaceae bacterium]|nr:3-phosphoshikimate 1-carboxyvinyltransferase [Neisseriaceae bacterium]